MFNIQSFREACSKAAKSIGATFNKLMVSEVDIVVNVKQELVGTIPLTRTKYTYWIDMTNGDRWENSVYDNTHISMFIAGYIRHLLGIYIEDDLINDTLIHISNPEGLVEYERTCQLRVGKYLFNLKIIDVP